MFDMFLKMLELYLRVVWGNYTDFYITLSVALFLQTEILWLLFIS